MLYLTSKLQFTAIRSRCLQLKASLSRHSKQIQFLSTGLVVISSLGLSSCGMLGVGYNKFLCQEQDYKDKCVRASTFLQHDQQQASVSQQIASQNLTTSNNLTTQTRTSNNHNSASIHTTSSSHSTNSESTRSQIMNVTTLSSNIPTADAMALAINGHNQALDNNNFLVRGYYAFPTLTYPQVIHNNYLVVWIAPIKLQGKVHAPTFFTLPYIH